MSADWWSAYSLAYDPLANLPVPRGDLDILVRTPVVEDLAAYLNAEQPVGRIFLLMGSYGTGKTTVLNSIQSLVEAGNTEHTVRYYDISKSNSIDKLKTQYKEVIQEAERLRENGKKPVFAFDQMHLLSTDLMQLFFREHQTDFEEAKARGLVFVFAGGEQYGDLAKTRGPLGAIFDRQFALPRFEQELTQQLIERRLKQACVGDYRNPFLPDAIAELTDVGEGTPRKILESAGRVMKQCAEMQRPILISRLDVRAATAELTEAARAKIRDELRSPNLGNALAKVSKLHASNNGHTRVYEVGKLLDAAFNDSGRVIEDIADSMTGLGVRPDMIVDDLVALGLTEAEKRTQKRTYGSASEIVHRLSREAVAALSAIRDHTSLLPSQYLHDVAASTVLSTVRTQAEIAQDALAELSAVLQSEKAKTFMARTIRFSKLIEGNDPHENEFIETFENLMRALSMEIFAEVREDWVADVRHLAKILDLEDAAADVVIGAVERLTELSELYRDHGVDWGETRREAARKSIRLLVDILVPRAASQGARGRSLRDEEELQQGLAQFYEESRGSMTGHSGGTIVKEVGKALANVPGAAGLDALTVALLSELDNATYKAAHVNDRDWHAAPIADTLARLRTGDTTEDTPWESAARLLNQLSERAPDVLGKKILGRRFGSVVQDALGTERGSARYLECKAVAFEPGWTAVDALLKTLVSEIRSATSYEEFRDSSLVLWYLIRNATSHGHDFQPSIGKAEELAGAFAVVVAELLERTFAATAAGPTGLFLVEQLVSPRRGWVASNKRTAVIGARDLHEGQIVQARSARPNDESGIVVYSGAADWATLRRVGPEALGTLPTRLHEGIVEIRRREKTEPTVRSTLKALGAKLNKSGNPCVPYGIRNDLCLVRGPEEELCGGDLAQAARAGAFVIVLPYKRGHTSNVNLQPILVGFNRKALANTLEALMTPKQEEKAKSQPIKMPRAQRKKLNF